MTEDLWVGGSCGPVSDNVFDDEEKSEIRRFCGYAALGDITTGQSSWRFFQSAGTLEWRLNTLSEPERKRARCFLATLAQMESALLEASETLDTARAAVWTRNTRELAERVRLLSWWRRRLCSFLGVAPGSDLSDPASVIM